jgi:hypothetical protein
MRRGWSGVMGSECGPRITFMYENSIIKPLKTAKNVWRGE